MKANMDEKTITLVGETTETGLQKLSTGDLDLTLLPSRLDDQLLAQVREIVEAPLPTLPTCDDRTFSQALRMMLAALPRRNADDVSGELFVAAYQRQLGHLNRSQVEFLMDKALQRCRWFPTIAECLEIVGEWRRSDEPLRRKQQAEAMVRKEELARFWDKQKALQEPVPPLTQEAVDNMNPVLIEIGLKCGSLRRDENGNVVVND